MTESTLPDVADYEFRSIRSEEKEDFLKLVHYVFAEEPPSEEQIKDDPLRPEDTTVAFHNGELVATSGGYLFDMRWNGGCIPVDGVTAVGTRPDHRRRGLVRRLVTERLQMCYEEGRPASILLASMAAIYQRFGYGLASSNYYCMIQRDQTALQFGDVGSGTTEQIPFDKARPICEELYERSIKDRTLMIHRTKVNWDIRSKSKKKIYVVLHRDEKGNPDGYAWYGLKFFRRNHREDGGPEQELGVSDLVYENADALRGIWSYFVSHDLVGRIAIGLSSDDILPNLLIEPRRLHSLESDSIWLRVVDVEKLLDARKYDVPGSVRFEITEDWECPWNIGTYELDSDGTNAQIRRTNRAPDFQISVNGLASLAAGRYTLTQLQRANRAQLLSNQSSLVIDALFSTRYAPHCTEDF